MTPKDTGMTIPGEIRISYNWSAGIAGSRFLRELRDNKRIMGTECKKCRRILVPPRIYCEECFDDDLQWIDVGTKGEIATFGVSYFSTDGKPLERPWMLGIIHMEGCDAGLVHYIDEVDPQEIRIGMKVEAVFKEERVGSILDIAYFRPVR